MSDEAGSVPEHLFMDRQFLQSVAVSDGNRMYTNLTFSWTSGIHSVSHIESVQLF